MYCPGCGATNTTQAISCARCGENLAAIADPLNSADKAVADEGITILLKKYHKGRRDTISGILLLAGAFAIMRVLNSTGMPPFIAFLWTSWLFFWGVISAAEGAGKWLASRDHIKMLGYDIHRAGQDSPRRIDDGRQCVTHADENARVATQGTR